MKREPAMLTLHDIRKDYGTDADTVHALRGVTLHFRPHEFVAILGASGCGKTTLLNTIGGRGRCPRRSRSLFGYRVKSASPFSFRSYFALYYKVPL